MKRVFTAILAVAFAGATLNADVTAYDKPRAPNSPYTRYKQTLPQTVPTSLTAVITQVSSCSSAVTGGTAATMGMGCGVYIDYIAVSCPTGSAGTILVQDLQSTPVTILPTFTNTANTMYVFALNFQWAPGGFKIQQVTGSGCVYYASWGQM